MEEILSSIRQIIADDDATRSEESTPLSESDAAGIPVTPAAPGMPQAGTIPAGADEALPLSPDQIVHEAETPEEGTGDDSVVAEFLDPDDVAFESAAAGEAQDAEEARVGSTEPVRPTRSDEMQPSRSAGAMPDPKLSEDMAEQLLEPATRAAVTSSIARLANLGLGTQGLTLEDLTRELLRPMLKQWLDEHLPSVVERVVEREIARISRGE